MSTLSPGVIWSSPESVKLSKLKYSCCLSSARENDNDFIPFINLFKGTHFQDWIFDCLNRQDTGGQGSDNLWWLVFVNVSLRLEVRNSGSLRGYCGMRGERPRLWWWPGPRTHTDNGLEDGNTDTIMGSRDTGMVTFMGPRDLWWSLDTMMGPLMVTIYNNGLQGQGWGLAEAENFRL